MENNKFYNQLNPEKKRKLREILAHHKELRENQREIFDRNLIKPITALINLTDDVHKSKISIEHYQKRSKEFGDYLRRFIGEIKNV